MKTRKQRRQRRPLGSAFVGQAPQKRSLAGAASCLLHNMVPVGGLVTGHCGDTHKQAGRQSTALTGASITLVS